MSGDPTDDLLEQAWALKKITEPMHRCIQLLSPGEARPYEYLIMKLGCRFNTIAALMERNLLVRNENNVYYLTPLGEAVRYLEKM